MPTIGDALAVNNAIRRAKQHADLSVVYRPIPLQDMAFVCHSDAACADAKGGATQAETRDGPCCAQSMWDAPPPCIRIADCKSLFDDLKSPSAPSLDDRRTSIDIVIIRESAGRMKASIRWIPTDRMLAGGVTKESADALDLLRACMKSGKYQVSPEKDVLEWRATERNRRKDVARRRSKFSAFLVSQV